VLASGSGSGIPAKYVRFQWSFRLSMVCFCSFQNVSPLFQASDDRQEFVVMYLVVPLSTGKTLGCESHWMPFVVLAQLG